MTETAVDAPAATRREWIALAVLALPTLLAATDFSVLFLLPAFTHGLNIAALASIAIAAALALLAGVMLRPTSIAAEVAVPACLAPRPGR